MKKSTSQTSFDKITDSVISLLEKSQNEGKPLSWVKSWKSVYPQNLKTKNIYKGVNEILTSLACSVNEWENPYFLTFKQAKEFNGKVKKGEKSLPILFVEAKEKDSDLLDEKGEPVKETYFIYKWFNIFNISQIEGLEIEIPKISETEDKPLLEAEKIVSEMPKLPEIKSGGGRCFYNPIKDFVGIPVRNSFKSIEDYYSSLFHELVHSTGHKSRLNRKGVSGNTKFGDSVYSKEELIAEFGSAFLCSVCGIENKTIENNTAYIQGWIKALKNDKSLLLKASSQAKKSVKFILNQK
ncbi:MAG: DUF1738 domain-containing protein [Calditrichaeota bacterium]|nr:MAG: DUF1738 domain-containing protein [Calditrichota bacterium]